jgi:DNA-directed RNA polymerase beta subunit
VQKPMVKYKQKVKAGDAIADGPSTFKGEMALGGTSWWVSCPGTVTTTKMRC